MENQREKKRRDTQNEKARSKEERERKGASLTIYHQNGKEKVFNSLIYCKHRALGTQKHTYRMARKTKSYKSKSLRNFLKIPLTFLKRRLNFNKFM